MIFWELFWTFFQIGAFTFGGGYAMLPLIQSEVASHGWMTDTQLEIGRASCRERVFRAV